MDRHALAFLLVVFAGGGAAGALRVAHGGDDDRQGTANGSSAQPAGTGPLKEELAREICQRLYRRCSYSSQRVGDILPGIEAGSFDLGFGMFLRTPERERRVLFSDAAWQASSRLLTTPGLAADYVASHGSEASLATLHGARVIALNGSAQHAALAARAEIQQLAVSGAATLAAVIAAVTAGEADFALVPVFSAYTVLRHDTTQPYEFSGPPLTGEGLGGSGHIALARGADSLRKKVNEAMTAMRADGTWQRIMRRHLPIGIY
jgi:ABC-type amino acid transport substrate-binding protein